MARPGSASSPTAWEHRTETDLRHIAQARLTPTTLGCLIADRESTSKPAEFDRWQCARGGQGTQLLELATLGCTVTGVEPSAELRELCSRGAHQRQVSIELLDGTVEDLDAAIGDRRFDLVGAHGLLMYLADRATAIPRSLTEPHPEACCR